MNREDDPELWDLLNGSSTPEPSAFFARNVLRAIRTDRTGLFTMWSNLRKVLTPISAIAAILITAATLHSLHNHRTSSSPLGDMIASADVQDADLTVDLDVLANDDDADDVSSL